jgi:acyl dehydratase
VSDSSHPPPDKGTEAARDAGAQAPEGTSEEARGAGTDARNGTPEAARGAGAHAREGTAESARGAGTDQRERTGAPARAAAAHAPQAVRVGQVATRSLTLTPEHVHAFAELSGDYNPLHFDEAFARATRFGALVVQGGLTTGLLHALVAMDLPGPGSVFLSQSWKFTAPVFIGDTITARAEVLHVHERKPVTQLAVRVTRQDGETVLEGEAWCYTMRPETSG